MGRYSKIILTLTLVIQFNLFGFILNDSGMVYGQSKGRVTLSQEGARDPFLLPPGVRPLSKNEAVSEVKGIRPISEIKPVDMVPSLKVKAILISDHVRLALIDRHIVTIGDSIQDEKILEIKADRVILGKRDHQRTLFLSQSPVRLTVEERKGEEK